MSQKPMKILYGSRKVTDSWIFKVMTNGSKFYIDKHDNRMKQLFATGKIKEFVPTQEIYRLKKENEKLKRSGKIANS